MLEQIGHLLRLRVLQELELLRLRLQASPTRAHHLRTPADSSPNSNSNLELAAEENSSSGSGSYYTPLLRRLTRGEWDTLKRTGAVPWKGVVAVLVVPPVNRDPETKQRVVPHFSELPPPLSPRSTPVGEKITEHTKSHRDTLPQSVLYPYDEDDGGGGEVVHDKGLTILKEKQLNHARVPLYNGASFFPNPGQRAALRQRLCEVLEVERKHRRRTHLHPHLQLDADDADSDAEKPDAPSHAFALFSSAETVLHADTVPLAIALWRVRMWEGGGFEGN